MVEISLIDWQHRAIDKLRGFLKRPFALSERLLFQDSIYTKGSDIVRSRTFSMYCDVGNPNIQPLDITLSQTTELVLKYKVSELANQLLVEIEIVSSGALWYT